MINFATESCYLCRDCASTVNTELLMLISVFATEIMDTRCCVVRAVDICQ